MIRTPVERLRLLATHLSFSPRKNEASLTPGFSRNPAIVPLIPPPAVTHKLDGSLKSKPQFRGKPRPPVTELADSDHTCHLNVTRTTLQESHPTGPEEPRVSQSRGPTVHQSTCQYPRRLLNIHEAPRHPLSAVIRSALIFILISRAQCPAPSSPSSRSLRRPNGHGGVELSGAASGDGRGRRRRRRRRSHRRHRRRTGHSTGVGGDGRACSADPSSDRNKPRQTDQISQVDTELTRCLKTRSRLVVRV